MANRLAQEKSPYLLQHQHNPVDWFPWGDEAFAKARAERKPVFLSIGYATCHWCHVMERESFESQEVADYLNQHFVAIKVDREERPDVDDIYMSVVQALSGSGGWPLSVFLTPDAKPFFGGTYFPHPGKYGRPGFIEVLAHLERAWREQNTELLQDADKLTDAVGQLTNLGPGDVPGTDALDLGYAQLAERFDARHGGFGTAMKFPTPQNMGFLLRHHARTGEPKALAMVVHTLDAMLALGLRDHLAGGFHRYCVDPAWTIPHFEKMLYDQAGLVRAYAEGYLVTGDERYVAVVRETLAFVGRDMTTPEGAFTSAWDADSEGEEGKCYVWTPAQVTEVLGAEDGALFCARYGVTAKGNFPEFPGQTHLQHAAALDDLARDRGQDVATIERRLETCRQSLLAARAERVPPLHDDKVLTDWNGLMIGACAVAGRALQDDDLTAQGARAADAVLRLLRDEPGRLMHRWREGHVAVDGLLEDHAFLAWGLLELFTSTGEARWLRACRELVDEMRARFWDAADGGFFMTPADSTLIQRSKPVYDGASPSGNSAAATVLVALGRLTGDDELWELGRRTLASYAGLLAKAPGPAGAQSLQALDLVVGPTREVVIAGDPTHAGTQALLAEIRRRFLPRTLLVQRGEDAGELADLVPFVAAQGPREGRPTAYVCRDYACAAPVHDPADLARQLSSNLKA
jgi:uncharacterized protein